jgi:hypothetical protein
MVAEKGDLNVEGAALAGRFLRLFNRGNGGAGSVNGSVDLPVAPFLQYLARAVKDPTAPFDTPFENPRRYRLGTTSDGFHVSITDAVTIGPLAGAPAHLRGEMRLLSAVAEHAASTIDDGASSDASIVLELPDGRCVIAPLTGVDRAGSLKIEGISATKAEWKGSPARLHVELLGVVDADTTDPRVPSQLARLEVVYTPEVSSR